MCNSFMIRLFRIGLTRMAYGGKTYLPARSGFARPQRCRVAPAGEAGDAGGFLDLWFGVLGFGHLILFRPDSL
jgi:hypothetical protein